MQTQTITRRTIKRVENRLNLSAKRGIRGLGDCFDPESGETIDCGSTYGVTYTTDDGNSNFWDNFLQLIQVGSTAAVNIIKADQQNYYTPTGAYRYGTGQYSALTPTQAQMYLQQRPGGITSGGSVTMNWTTLAMVGMAGLMLVMLMGRR